MAKNPSLGIRFDEQDKAMLREVATRLFNGNQTETLRQLVRTTLQVLKEQDAQDQSMQTEPASPKA